MQRGVLQQDMADTLPYLGPPRLTGHHDAPRVMVFAEVHDSINLRGLARSVEPLEA